jgi:surface protein
MKFIQKLNLLITILLVSLNSCNQEEESLPGLQGSVSFGGISLDFEPMGSPGNRISGNSTWVHVFPNSANLIFTNKVTRERHILKYDPNDHSKPASITLPFGNYEYYSAVDGGVYSAYLPFEASGEFSLKSQSLEIKLKADTNHGLVTVKNQMVEIASISDGKKESELLVDKGTKYWFIYANRGTKSTLKVKESLNGSTVNRDLDIEANQHINFKLNVNENSAAALTMEVFKQEGGSESISKFFEENGTIKCPGAVPGEKGKVNNHTYEAVDRALLIKRRDEGADLSCVCTSLVTDMSTMFQGSEFNHAIGNWDVSNVKNMSQMFSGARNFNQPIEKWNVCNVTNMIGMFSGARSFNQSIGSWDVGKVKLMNWMFAGAGQFNQPIGGWDVSNVIQMGSMFASSGFNQPIGDWNVSNVEYFGSMFEYAYYFNQPIGNWNVSKATIMRRMFESAQSFNQSIGNWDVGNVIDMSYMFKDARSFNQPIGNWDVSSVENMQQLFENAGNFNQPIGKWDVRNVTNMAAMFSNAENFNQPIGDWDVSNVNDMGSMFRFAESFNQPIGNWDVRKVTNMESMFVVADSFNQNIENWDVSKVTNMFGMFRRAVYFNQPIGNWNVGNVREMGNMFFEAVSFNQDLTSWCVQNIQTEPQAFSTESALIDVNKPIWGTCPD